MNTILKQEGPAILLLPLSRPAASPNQRRDIYCQLNTVEIKEMIREAVQTAIVPYRSELETVKGKLQKVRRQDTFEKLELNK